MPDQPQLPGAAVLELVAIMDRLRTECPWDARQTHSSLVPYLLEETYETLEAIERGDIAELRGELGDLLLQVLFHSRIAAERTDGTRFTIDDVATDIAEKLVRRHPHVFADVSVSGAEEVKRNWETIKAEERAAAGRGRGSALDGVPMSQPALSLAAQLQRRASAAGAPPELADLSEGDRQVTEATELAAGQATAGQATAGQAGAIGAELFALVARARAAGVDPELELRRAAQTFRDRFQAWEQPPPDRAHPNNSDGPQTLPEDG
jgi:XTP/dITP diphosphohydrolase